MPSTFNTLEREKLFLNPSSNKYGYPELQKLVKPHIDSFNSLLEPPSKGILNIAIDDIGAQEIFDVPYISPERGNKLTSNFNKKRTIKKKKKKLTNKKKKKKKKREFDERIIKKIKNFFRFTSVEKGW